MTTPASQHPDAPRRGGRWRLPLLARLRRVARAVAGFSATETAAILAGVSIVAGTAGPQLQDYLESARMIKAQGDVRVLAVCVVRLINDVGQIGPRSTGSRDERPSLLVSDGATPGASGPESQPWAAALDGRLVQELSAHLVDNRAGYPTSGGRSWLRWRGPYVERLTADPWGSRYAVNVGFLMGVSGYATVVLSPGPNKVVDTPFEMIGLRTGGDDVIGLVSSGK